MSKMVNYSIYYGSSIYDAYKLKLPKYLPKNWKCTVVSATDKNIGPELQMEHENHKFEFKKIYNHPIFNTKFDHDEIKSQEEWLGIPFQFILESNYHWKYSWKNYFISFI